MNRKSDHFMKDVIQNKTGRSTLRINLPQKLFDRSDTEQNNKNMNIQTDGAT